MSERATCWSITINNPNDDDMNPTLPAQWALQGQLEQGSEGTVHYQGMLTTPQVRFSAVKKVFPRAHIEVAKNKVALAKYVKKEETRLQSVPDVVSKIPTLFDYQHTIASKWIDKDFDDFRNNFTPNDQDKLGIGELALLYVDTLVDKDIRAGVQGVEYIAINPMWRSAWKKFWQAMIYRERNCVPAQIISEQDIQDASSSPLCSQETDAEETQNDAPP